MSRRSSTDIFRRASSVFTAACSTACRATRRNRTNVWDYASVNSFKGSRREDLALHPTVKPGGLVADAIQDVTRRGDLVLDLFLGSGTTLVAAERVGRRFRGVRHRSGLRRRSDRSLDQYDGGRT
jgi:DNA modification methylase